MKKLILLIALAFVSFAVVAKRPEKKSQYIHYNGSSILLDDNSITVKYLGSDDCILYEDAWRLIQEKKEKYTIEEFVEDAKKSRGYDGETGSALREFDLAVINVIRKFKKTLSAGDIYFVHIIPKDKSRTIEVLVEVISEDKGWVAEKKVYPLGYLNGKHSM